MFKVGTPVVSFDIKGISHLGAITKIQLWDHPLYSGSDEYYIIWDDGDESWYDEDWVEIYIKQAIEGKELIDEINKLDAN